MTNAELADEFQDRLSLSSNLREQRPYLSATHHDWQQIIAALRKPCPHIVTDKDGTSYCSLAEPPSWDKIIADLKSVVASVPERQPSSDKVLGLFRVNVNSAVPENEVWVSDGKQLVKITNLLAAAEARGTS